MRRLLPTLLAATAISCTEGGGPVTIDDRTGVVRGMAFVDRNADGEYAAASDALAEGVTASLLLDGTGVTVAATVTAADGSFRMTGVPIGRYRLVAERGALGDTVEVQLIENAVFSLAQNDTVVRDVRIGYPRTTAAALGEVPFGRRVVIEGLALNNWSAFGDSTVHVTDLTGSVRTMRVAQSNVQAGDSVRMLGTVAERDGQPVLTSITPIVIRAGVGLAPPDSVSTAAAATAGDGAFDAALVRIGGPIVAAQTLPNGDMVVGVDDGSGLLEVVLDDAIPFTPSQFQPGAVLQATGVLVPVAGSAWQLKPRSTADASAAFPTVTIADARMTDVGRTVHIHGIALNARVTFGDNTVHIADASGVIRTLGVTQPGILAGDSIRILGTVAMRNGQPVLNASSASVLLAGVGLPAIDSVTTAIAATAEGGARDADQVAVSGVISATDNRGSEVILTISDGSGDLIVVLDPDVGFATGNYTVGDGVRVRGVLVPAADGTSWELKPRLTAEIVVVP